MSSVNRLQDLIAKLEEMFELDKTELDFGLHRIIKARHTQVRDYLSNRLPTKVTEVLQATQQGASQEKLAAAKAKVVEAFGSSALAEDGQLLKYGDSPIGQRYLEVFEESRSYDVGALNDDVYRHLLTFFARYYEDGDFISQRRYTSKGKERYSIPYNGEEVLLHWANKDQYYIKSSEDLKDYRFTLGEGAAERVVKFQLVAQDPVENNNKAKRILELAREDEGKIAEESLADGKPALVIPFRFSLVPKARTAPESKQFVDALLKSLPTAWQPILAAKAATDKDKDRTQLAKHFANYQGLGSRDYFIHKNLGAFLRHELDHYIKTEVMDLDDVDAKGPEYLSREIRKIKAIRAVALDLITFLAQFENFQKKLWLKKKFVTRRDYLVTIDRLSPALREVVAANTAQWAEWEKLGFKQLAGAAVKTKAKAAPMASLSTEKKKPGRPKGHVNTDQPQLPMPSAVPTATDEASDAPAPAPVSTAPWRTRAYLDANNKLVIDTRFFPASFIQQMLASREVLAGAESLETAQTGLLIHSENFQALNLLQERYREQVKCIYIDPPYNTEDDRRTGKFAYKDSFEHSSWISFVYDRISTSKKLWSDDGIYAMSSDRNECVKLELVSKSILGESSYINTLCLVNNPQGRSDEKHIATAHENILFFANESAVTTGWKASEKIIKRYQKSDGDKPYRLVDLRKTGGDDRREDREKMFYYFFVDKNTGDLGLSFNSSDAPENSITITPIRADGTEGRWRWGYENSMNNKGNLIAKKMDRRDIYTVYEKDYLSDDEKEKPTSVWSKSEFISHFASLELKNLIEDDSKFPHPKSSVLIQHIQELIPDLTITTLDFFAGSGTTGHAVINLNREDGGNRKFILIEMGRYFDTVLKPRIAKVLYSPDWKDGQAQTHGQGSSALVKVLRLESYEDTLNNLRVNEEKDLLGLFSEVKEEYLLSYMLDVETEESLLDLKEFTDPWAYQLKIYDPESGKALPQPVDLVETFNYLLGLRLSETRFETINGKLFQSLEGLDARAQSLLVIWRQLSDDPEQDRKNLESFLAGHRGFNPKDSEYHAIYINGDHNLHDPHKKIQPLEASFHRLMFEAREE